MKIWERLCNSSKLCYRKIKGKEDFNFRKNILYSRISFYSFYLFVFFESLGILQVAQKTELQTQVPRYTRNLSELFTVKSKDIFYKKGLDVQVQLSQFSRCTLQQRNKCSKSVIEILEKGLKYN